MKKALALLLTLCLVFALAACGQEGAQTSDPPASEAPEETPGEDITSPALPPVEVVVFAAASMEATLTEIA